MDCVGPQGQPWSEGAQPAAEMAEERQPVAQAGSPERSAAVVSVRRVVRVRSWNFIVAVVVVVVLIGFVFVVSCRVC
jgi:hypothetical protein